MPWWIWLVLTIAMIASLAVGTVYAIKHGLRALHTVGKVSAQFSKRFEAMAEPVESDPDQPAVFTQPLRVAAQRYSDAHVDVIKRDNRKRNRHVRQWARWDRFNNPEVPAQE